MARKKTLASKIGVSRKRLSSKIRKVTKDSPGLTRRQVAGKQGSLSDRRRLVDRCAERSGG